MQPLVSIIIPFYNEEEYLAKAITSAVGQSYAPLEIILVNDGSVDRSLDIAKSFKDKLVNVKLISTENKGLSHARNVGMSVASGEYISFLDSDDELCPAAIATWIAKIQESEADIVIGKFAMLNSVTGQPGLTAGWKGDGTPINGYDGIKGIYEYRITYTAWAKLYRTSIASQLQFPEGYWFEDRPFLLSYFLKTKKIVFDDSCHVRVLSRKDSITRRLISERRIKDMYAMYLLELNLVADHPESKTIKSLMDSHCINTFLETLIIFYYDRKIHPEPNKIKRYYSEIVNAFNNHLKKNGTTFAVGLRADLLLIQLHKFVGWQLLFLILPFWKRKKCKSVLRLKSS